MASLARRNPLHGRPATAADPYDWGNQDESEAPVARSGYRQVVDELRGLIFSAAYPAGSSLPGQAPLSRDLRVDVATVNRAVTALAAEGLVRVEHGRRTAVLPRRRWRVEFTTGPTTGLGQLVRSAARQQPAVSGPQVTRTSVTMSVESADVAGALTAALGVIRDVVDPAGITAVSAVEA